ARVGGREDHRLQGRGGPAGALADRDPSADAALLGRADRPDDAPLRLRAGGADAAAQPDRVAARRLRERVGGPPPAEPSPPARRRPDGARGPPPPPRGADAAGPRRAAARRPWLSAGP